MSTRKFGLRRVMTANQIVAYNVAKARALQTGRPCGVMLICDLPLGLQDPSPSATGMIPNWPTRQVTKLYLAEVPPPYSGGTIGAKGRIMYSLNPGAPANTYEFHPLYADTSVTPTVYRLDTTELSILGPNAASGVGLIQALLPNLTKSLRPAP